MQWKGRRESEDVEDTHGTSEQRMRWFTKGLKSGKIEGGDTFSMPYRDL
jgi:predicted metalloprotease